MAEYHALVERGDSDGAAKKVTSCVYLTQKLLLILLEALLEEGVDYIVAPYSANAQIAYLVKNGYANFAIGEDSEMPLYKDVRFTLFKYNPGSFAGNLYDAEKLPDCFNPKDFNYTFTSFRRFCILSGCDFVRSLKGIAINKAKKFFNSVPVDSNVDILFELPRVLSSKALVVPQKYVEDFRLAELAFDYELVIDPATRKLVHLNPVPKHVQSYVKQFSRFSLKDSQLLDYALGILDFKTLEPLEDYSHLRKVAEKKFFNNPVSVWHPKCPRVSMKNFLALKAKGRKDEDKREVAAAKRAATIRAQEAAGIFSITKRKSMEKTAMEGGESLGGGKSRAKKQKN